MKTRERLERNKKLLRTLEIYVKTDAENDPHYMDWIANLKWRIREDERMLKREQESTLWYALDLRDPVRDGFVLHSFDSEESRNAWVNEGVEKYGRKARMAAGINSLDIYGVQEQDAIPHEENHWEET